MNPELKKLAELGLVKAGIGFYQEFHKLDVYQHTLICVEKLELMGAKNTLIAAGYLHDIGKPRLALPIFRNGKIATDDEGHILHQFKDGHEVLGREMVLLLPEEIFAELGIDQEEVAEIVGCHYLPMKYFMNLKYVQNKKQLKTIFDEMEKALNSAPAKRENIIDIFVADCLAKLKYAKPHIPALKLLYGLLRKEADNFEEVANLWVIYDSHIKNNTAHLMTSEIFRLSPEQSRLWET
jgi:hypothetical protein